ncbi:ABC transporter substrate-binding protein [Actinokineospora terrae]|uniref:ABC-type branched-chain amino acid transport system, substrate-binding protein n=1 Tax=Actinokineospora terrae TaxID=155974 RepID=A0A1H9N0G6_9PSEU|nr:ABC transporter substrate-binding protein [Actinokineospora terrae]SER29480.1 ABC-type branched-chain amino acid transport system, substrate-binding protein [Actinokineospora terrae]
MTYLLVALVVLLGWAWVLRLALARRRIQRSAAEIRPDSTLSRRGRVLLAVGVVALPLVAVTTAAPVVLCFGGGIDLGVTVRGWFTKPECVGLTDGDHSFSGALTDVSDQTRLRYDEVMTQIGDQNDNVTGPRVRIGFMASLTSPLAGPRIVHELAGLAQAQRALNAQDDNPQVELVLANTGAGAAHWEPVVEDLIALSQDDPPLVAVVGLGLSQEETRLAARRLGEAGIPMVSDVVTAAKLDPTGEIPNFHRVPWANRVQFEASIGLLRAKGIDTAGAFVVRNDDPGDTYSRTSAESVRELLGSGEDWTFGAADTDPEQLNRVLGSQFRRITDALCPVLRTNPAKPALVFYAGRARHLSSLMEKLAGRECGQGRVLVVSASDAAIFRMGRTDPVAATAWGYDKVLASIAGGKVSLYFTSLAEPDSLADREKFAELRAAFAGRESELDTGWAVMSWDALHVATAWARDARDETSDDPGVYLRQMRVSAEKRFTRATPYQGASGDFSFDPTTGDRVDTPTRLPTPLSLHGDGTLCRPDPTTPTLDC